MSVYALLVSYAIAFGIQNKVPWIHGKIKFFDSMFECTYCTGFHTGWITWCLWAIAYGLPATGWSIPGSLLTWAFASSIFCYGVDVVLRWFESNTPVES